MEISGVRSIYMKRVLSHTHKNQARKTSTSLLGITLLSSVPLMRVVIFGGKRWNPVVELRINPFVEEIGTELDEYYILKNSGPGKQFPGGPHPLLHIPTSNKISCLYEWSEKGSTPSDILKNILETLDHLDLFDRTNRVTSVAILDGYGSCLGLQFLQYLNNSDNLWTTTIRVPCSNNLWKVGDSKDQSGITR